jgi:predicted O-methyltransferase YrrM
MQTLCLAEGLTENGTIDTIDNNEELFDFQKNISSNLFGKSNRATSWECS